MFQVRAAARPARKCKAEFQPVAGEAAAAAAAAASRAAVHAAAEAAAAAPEVEDDVMEAADPSAPAAVGGASDVDDPLECGNLQALDGTVGSGAGAAGCAVGLTGEEDFAVVLPNFPHYGVGEADWEVPAPTALVDDDTHSVTKCTLAELTWVQPLLFQAA